MRRLTLAAGFMMAFSANAQTIVPERELDTVRQLYVSARYADVVRRTRDALALANFTDDQRLELNKFAGAAAYTLGDTVASEQHFLRLLQINPDFVLDPFAFPPPVVKFLDEVRRKNSESLGLVRQQIALRLEQAKREADERERLRLREEEQRRRVEALTRTVTETTVEKKPYIINFLPFGAGQFQQDRTGWGVAFATTEGATAAASIVAYFALEGLMQTKTYTFDNRLFPPDNLVPVTVRGIPAARKTEADVWRAVKFGTGIAFYALYVLNVVDALVHHRDAQTTTIQRPLVPDALPGAQLELYPLQGGAGASVSVDF